jgi:hypothetical protein
MLYKWVNRSYDVLWSLNGGLVVVTVCWWCWVLLRQAWLGQRGRAGLLWRRFALAGSLTAALTAFVLVDAAVENPNHMGGSSSLLVRIGRYFSNYPNFCNYWQRGFDLAKVPALPETTNAGWLKAHTSPGERVTLLSRRDWMYLVEAGRVPRLHWVQLILVHTPVLLQRCLVDLHDSETVFVEKTAYDHMTRLNQQAYDRVVPLLQTEFVLEEENESWEVYHRKSHGEGPCPGN